MPTITRLAIAALTTLSLFLNACTHDPERPPVSAREPIATFPSILFEPGSSALSPERREKVKAIAIRLKSADLVQKKLLVAGYTDSAGDENLNKKLARERSEAVMRELVFNGIPRERMIVKSYGEAEPVAPNTLPDGADNPAGRALNRRVEIMVQD